MDNETVNIMSKISEVYTQRKNNFEARAETLSKRYNRVSYGRLTLFLAGIALAVYVFNGYGLKGSYVLLFLFISFLFIAKWHDKLKAERNYFLHLSQINKDELAALNHDFSAFDTGEQFMDYEHPYSSDLDIFGQGSVYQFINRTLTIFGKKTLAGSLQSPCNKIKIEARQLAVKELSNLLDWRQDFQAIGKTLSDNHIEEKESDVQELLNWLQSPPVFSESPFIKTMSFLLPIVFVVICVLYAFGMVSGWILALSYLFNLAFIRFVNHDVEGIIQQTAAKSKWLQTYQQLFAHVENPDFTSPHLQQLQQRLQHGNTKAADSIGRLSQLSANLNIRDNLLAWLIFNTTVLWELFFCIRLENWKKEWRGSIEEWFAILGEFETLSSFANMSYNNSGWAFPRIHSEFYHLSSKELGHFLINPKVRVCNDIAIDRSGKILLITGSNMAGKSTFLRTVGINIVLAMAGCPVCAKELDTSVVHIYSSMRNKDSLMDSASSFYAELYGLKRVIDVVEAGKQPVFFLLDEILKGTNSQDRHKGSKALLKQLLKHDGVGLVSTHDLDLCIMENDFSGQIENWCFEVQINAGEMLFDYKFKRGICQSMNASILMQQMGIEM